MSRKKPRKAGESRATYTPDRAAPSDTYLWGFLVGAARARPEGEWMIDGKLVIGVQSEIEYLRRRVGELERAINGEGDSEGET